MGRVVAVGIVVCFLLSIAPLMTDEIPGFDEPDFITENSRIIEDSELTLQQIEALNSVGMSRNANTNWSATGGSMEVDEIYEMIFDSQGNIIVCGTIYQVSQFGSITVSTQGEGDILIAKLSKTGVWQWAVSAGTALYYDECRGVTIDSNDNVYGTGYFRGDVDFGGTVISTTGFDGWLARVNSTGQWDWAMKFGGFDIDVGWDVVADNYDNLYVTGFYQNLTEFNATQLVDYSQSGERTFYLAYYNVTAEQWDWAKDSTGNGVSEPYQLVLENSTNSVYVTGYSTDVEQWGGGSFTSNPASTWAGFVVKYNETGSFKWGRSTGGAPCTFQNCGAYFTNIVIHPEGGVVVGGNFVQTYKDQSGTINSGYGNWDVFVKRYQANGTELWSYFAGSTGDDRLQSLSVNQKGQVQFGGTHLANMSFGSNTLAKNSTSGYYDGFIAQIDNNSNYQWSLSIGGYGNDTVGALLSFPDGSLLAGGDFSGTVWFGNTPKSSSDSDIFVWKFQHDKDGDGIPDYNDNCLNIQNLNQTNYDSDRKGDACDSDDDNDGLHDVLDDCQFGFMNWNQSNVSLDYDSDSCNDIEEDNDDDNDGILDLNDNCPLGVLDWIVDSSTDLDGDGCRDSDEDMDDDGDSVLDVDDNCQYLVNPLQEDYENDGLGDVCDSDDDGDGINDPLDDCTQGAINWTSEFQTDKDGDGCEDEGSNEDLDDDNDGIFDENDNCPRGEIDWLSSLETDRDGDGCRNDNEDNDNDNDSVINEIDGCKNGITNWTKNATNDNDADGCLDDREDNDDDNDGFSDTIDFCPLQEGNATQGGAKGCPDFDEDGWADLIDDFLQDDTQWSDGDNDGYGDNPLGNNADDCPFFFGNSSQDRKGCIDTDGDGYSDEDNTWTISRGADAFKDEPSQWSDTDEDGFGDNFDGVNFDLCPDVAGTSTIDRNGCLDSDGDGYSDEDAFWGISLWDSLDIGPDEFPYDSTQWRDTDKDLFGDNWGNPEWNESRQEDWPGVFIENATSADMCPLEMPDGRFDDDINYPGCLLDEPSDGGKSNTEDSSSSDDSSGMDTMTLFGIIGGVVVIALVGVITMLLRKGPQPTKKRVKSAPKPLTNLPEPAPPTSPPQDSAHEPESIPGDDSSTEKTGPPPPKKGTNARYDRRQRLIEERVERERKRQAQQTQPETDAVTDSEPSESNQKPTTIINNVVYNISDSAISGDISTDLKQEVPGAETVGSWEDLPGGDYLDPDEHGTNWFRANNGDNWYQNLDGTWTKWID